MAIPGSIRRIVVRPCRLWSSRRVLALAILLSLSGMAFSVSAAGVPYVDGLIGDHPVRFLVDTGASEVSIPYERAIDLGIPIMVGRSAEARTASGTVDVYQITLDSITVDGVTVHDVAASVTLQDTGSQEILLGMSYLRHVTLRMSAGMPFIGPGTLAVDRLSRPDVPVGRAGTGNLGETIRSHLVYLRPRTTPPDAYAEFDVRLLPDGRIIGQPELIKPSGVAGFDAAALRAILDSNPLPQPAIGPLQEVRIRLTVPDCGPDCP